MDEIVRGTRTSGSVWGVAAVAVAVFVAIVVIAGMFGSPEIATIASAG
ncbi:MAG: hypothetical protein VYD64_09245 [Pseudomonadota bacterium]|nr:hypothetical protein [Pseudomonadota bacterium]